MSTTGAKYPTAAQSISESPWSDNDWVNPTNIYGAGEAEVSAATFDAGDQTYVLKAYTFDFSAIPDGAVINGVICIVNARYATALGSIDLMQLLDVSRAKVGTNQCATPVALTTSPANYTKGSSSDLWGNALTAAWVKDADFGVAIGMLAGGSGNNNVDVYCDYVTLEVYYTAPIQLAIANVAQAQATEAPALTQHNVLSAANMAQVQAIETVALVQHNILAIGNTAQAQAVENPILTAHEPSTQLVIADVTQGQATQGIDLTQHNTLTIADAAQMQAADGPALIQHNVLSIANSAQAQATDGLTLTQHNNLSIANVAQAQAADNLELTYHAPGGVSLTIADVSQAQAIEAITLTQHNILTIGDVSQGQVIEAMLLTQHNVLTIADATQAQAIENIILTAHEPGGGVVLVIQNVTQGQELDTLILSLVGSIVVTTEIAAHAISIQDEVRHAIDIDAEAIVMILGGDEVHD